MSFALRNKRAITIPLLKTMLETTAQRQRLQLLFFWTMTKSPVTALALFDLDHTLLPLDSDHGWGEFTMAIGWCDRAEFGRRNDAFFDDYLAGRAGHPRLRALCHRGRGAARPEAAAAAAHAAFYGRGHPPGHPPGGHRPGAPRIRTRATWWSSPRPPTNLSPAPLPRPLACSELLATELERGPDGWFTGDVQAMPNMREGKVLRMRSRLAARGRAWGRCGDHLLQRLHERPAAAGDGAATRWPPTPMRALRALAQERGWPVLDLF